MTQPNPTAAEAARLISLGYRVLRMRAGGKTPAVAKGQFGKKFPEFTCPADSFGPGHGLAILCGPCGAAGPGRDLVCLDLDGDQATALGGLELPPTLTSKGGAHRWYFAPAGALGCGNDWFGSRPGPALDVKASGGYAVEFPSLNAKGVQVQWDSAEWREPAELPAAVLAELTKRRSGRRAIPVAYAARTLAESAAPAVAGQQGHAALWALALDLVKGMSMSEADALAVLKEVYNPRCSPPWSEAELQHKVRDAAASTAVTAGYKLGETVDWLMGDRGIRPVSENINRFLRVTRPGLRWDVVAEAVVEAGQYLDIASAAWALRSQLSAIAGFDPPTTTCITALEETAKALGHVDQITGELDALPKWDGHRRISTWLTDYLGAADTPYHRAVGRAWLISAVARAYVPGCKVDHMLILEGEQGLGKGSALAVLGGSGFKDLTLGDTDKDAVQAFRRAWIVEYSELEGMDRKEAEWLKAHISRAVDTYRPSYGRSVKDIPRRCVLAGTLNPKGDGRYLKDEQNRRFWPVACQAGPATKGARMAALACARSMIWAEAVAAYRAGELWYLEGDVGQVAAQEERRVMDPLEESVQELLPAPGTRVTVASLRDHPKLARLLDGTVISRGRRLGVVLRRKGYQQVGSNGVWYWVKQ